MAGRGWLAAAGVALFAVSLFLGASLSRDSDDEAVYAGLAAKMRAEGMSGYNLRGLSIDSAGKFWKLDPDEKANFLPLMARSGLTYYDTPLFFNPPLFSFLLYLSHELLNRDLYFVVLKEGEPFGFYADQLYLALPNALFSVFFLAGVFVLGRRFFGEGAGIVAALLCLSSPVFLVSLFKTWSDLSAATFILWSYILWRDGEGKAGSVLASGALFALALLTRTSALFALALFVPVTVRRFRALLLWAVPVVLLAGPWFWAVHRTYGTPFYFPEAKGAKESMEWLRSISKPWYFYLLNLAYLSPFFLASVAAVRKERARLLVWAAAFVVPLSALLYTQKPLGLEDRYLLPCYPALAVLAAKAFWDVRARFKGPLPVLALSAALLWSGAVGATLVVSRESLKFTPW